MTQPNPSDISVEPILSIPGSAVDHLYREGSAKASFWEALFGSSLRTGRRTHISTLPDGTRVFDVPVGKIEHELLRSAQVWMTSPDSKDMCREGAALLASKDVAVKLIGLQPQGHKVATFVLRFERKDPLTPMAPSVPGEFRSWFGAEGARIAEETLVPFGFTPEL